MTGPYLSTAPGKYAPTWLITGQYLRTDPGKCTSDQSKDWSRAWLQYWISALFVKIKMPKSACSVGNQNVEAGERERGSGEKTTSLAKMWKMLAKKIVLLYVWLLARLHKTDFNWAWGLCKCFCLLLNVLNVSYYSRDADPWFSLSGVALVMLIFKNSQLDTRAHHDLSINSHGKD